MAQLISDDKLREGQGFAMDSKGKVVYDFRGRTAYTKNGKKKKIRYIGALRNGDTFVIPKKK